MPHYSDIPYSNPDTDRAFNALLAALEEIAPGVRANLKWLLEYCLPNAFQGRLGEDGQDARHNSVFLELPPEEEAAFMAVEKLQDSRLRYPGKTDLQRRLDAFRLVRRLRFNYDLNPLGGSPQSLALDVRAGDNPSNRGRNDPDNTDAEDHFALSVIKHDPATRVTSIRSVAGSRFIHPSRVGDAQPSFANALRDASLDVTVMRFADTVREFRTRIESMPR